MFSFAPNANRLLLITENGPLEIWDTQKGTVVAKVTELPRGPHVIRFSASQKQFLISFAEVYQSELIPGKNVISIFDSTTGKLVSTHSITLREELADATDWAWHWLTETRLLAQANIRQNPARPSVKSRFVELDLATNKLKISDWLEVGDKLTLSPDRCKAVLGYYFGVSRHISGGIAIGGRGVTHKTHLIDLTALKLIQTLDDNERTPESPSIPIIRWSRNNRFIVTAQSDSNITIWDAKDGAKLQTIATEQQNLMDVDLFPNGDRVVTASDDKLAKIWESRSGRLLVTLKGHTKGVNTVFVAPDGKWIATGSQDCTVRIWNAETGELQNVLEHHDSGVVGIDYDDTTKILFTTTLNGSGIEWKMPECRVVSIQRNKSPGWSRFGRCLLRIRIWEMSEMWYLE